jgi:hypothetical protein
VARIAVGLVVLGAPFFGASVVNGAMGTSHTLITQFRPDLVSVTTPGNSGSTTANFCFSKDLGIAGGASGDDFTIGGYENDEQVGADSIAQISTRCIEATYTNSDTNDLKAYSYGQIDQGTVQSSSGGGVNLEDSAPLNGSTSHNGTRGFTTGPDLQVAQLRPSQNQIAYAFDQQLRDDLNNNADGYDGTACTFGGGGDGCGSFKYIDGDGDYHFDIAAQVVDNPVTGLPNSVVVAQFCPVPPSTTTCDPFINDTVGDAEIAVAEQGAAESRTVEGNDSTQFAVTPIGGSATGDTNDPDLQSAELVNGGDSDKMLFTYNDQISAGNSGDCYALMSDTRRVQADDETVTGPATLQVDFPDDLANVSEFIVGGGDFQGCAVSAQNGDGSTQGAKPSGDNQNAFAIGYSTGPDAQSPVTINATNDTATVQLDQRIDPSRTELELIDLVGANGNTISHPLAANVSTQPPGPQILHLTFGASEVPDGTVGIRFEAFGEEGAPSALKTFRVNSSVDNFFPQENVEQVFAP